MPNKISLKRSNSLVGGTAKVPSATDLDYGELAINYSAGHEAVFIKNSANNVVNVIKTNTEIAATQGNLTSHIANKANPHSVTKAQVGLGDVDNTSDAAKPLSNAATTALSAKLDKQGGIVNNLTTNSTSQALSAEQGVVLKGMIQSAQSSSSSATQQVQSSLDAIQSRVTAVEEEVDGAEALADQVIAQETTLINDYNN